MSTKKKTENTEDKANGKSVCPCRPTDFESFNKDQSINNYNYDYHYTYDKVEKEPFFYITDRGRGIANTIAALTLGVISAIVIFAVITSSASINRIEKMLDKTPVPVHNAPSINHHTK